MAEARAPKSLCLIKDSKESLLYALSCLEAFTVRTSKCHQETDTVLVRSTVPLRLLLIGFVGFWVNYICWANNTPPGQITPNEAFVFKRKKTKGEKKKKLHGNQKSVSCVRLLNNSDLNCSELLTLTLHCNVQNWRFRC